MKLPETGHDPVLVDEVIAALVPGGLAGGVYVDCTLGRGGHARIMGERVGAGGTLVGLDADERNLKYAAGRLEGLSCATRLFHANFSEMAQVMTLAGLKKANCVLADLGVSTNQLFDPEYGMSMSVDGDLDMRLDRARGTSAAEIVNRWPEERIADVLYENADERMSRRIARKIAAERRVGPIKGTKQLADIVRTAIGIRGDSGLIDPATRTFQALRMEANREVENLGKLLQIAPGFLSAGGRLAVISFHSGEDRLVKQAFRTAEESGSFRVIGKKPISPMEAEIAVNPRSRSAKLRVLERLA